MKKLLLPFMAGAMLFASCSKESDATQTFNYEVYNLATSVNPGEAPVVSEGKYAMLYNISNGTVTVSTNYFLLPGNQNATFLLNNIPYTSSSSATGQQVVINTDVPVMGTGSTAAITDFRCTVTNDYVVYPSSVPGVLGTTVFYSFPMMKYTVDGNYTVRTFQRDNTFLGSTTTSYPAEGGYATFENDNIYYRVVMDVKALKADVVLYKAKFAEAAPELTMILKNLTLEFTNSGYVVRGTDIIPNVVEGNATTPNPKYPFNSFTLQTSNDSMTAARCEYKVAGVFTGIFSGSTLRTK